MLLNCDLGESYGEHRVGDDAAVMPHIDQASIACGFHGGDPITLKRALALAAQFGVSVGAHPSYPDREGFGRRSMALAPDILIASLHYQIAALEGMAASAGTALSYVKPHGALYNDMMASADIRATVMSALSSYHRTYPLMLQATPDWETHLAEASDSGLELQFEAFADRRYTAQGALQPRSEPGAVLDAQAMFEQVRSLCANGTVLTAAGDQLALHAQTLCVHGDNPEAVAHIRTIRQIVDGT